MEDLRKNYQTRIQADVAGGDSIYQASNKVKLYQRLMQVLTVYLFRNIFNSSVNNS